MRKQPISTAVVLEFSELLKLLNEVQNHIETLACYLSLSECKHTCHCDLFIFYISL